MATAIARCPFGQVPPVDVGRTKRLAEVRREAVRLCRKRNSRAHPLSLGATFARARDLSRVSGTNDGAQVNGEIVRNPSSDLVCARLHTSHS